MKRTIEEMLSFIKEEELEEKMVGIAMNNDKNYGMFPVEITDFRTEDGKYYVTVPGYGEEEIEAIDDVDMGRLRHHLNRLTAIFVMHGMDTEKEEVSLIVAYGDNEDDSFEKLYKSLFIDILQYFECNTYGKLKTLISKSEEIGSAYVEKHISRQKRNVF